MLGLDGARKDLGATRCQKVGGLMNRFTMAVLDVCLLLLDKGQKLGHNDDQ